MILWGENAMTLHGIPTGILVCPVYLRISFCKVDDLTSAMTSLSQMTCLAMPDLRYRLRAGQSRQGRSQWHMPGSGGVDGTL
jgi:hypothetical protein